ncbi:hypothetical protein COO60DRAFT_1539370 [Scenedesmus sp. NREL 46B-D3]|nr:hypothetical protein COO60DRAFT_1539370 [Scenedesmus sp. NREL 46B-D3]
MQHAACDVANAARCVWACLGLLRLCQQVVMMGPVHHASKSVPQHSILFAERAGVHNPLACQAGTVSLPACGSAGWRHGCACLQLYSIICQRTLRTRGNVLVYHTAAASMYWLLAYSAS